MKKYSDYTTEDFIQDSTFVSWVLQKGHQDMSHFWTRWVEAHPEQQVAIVQAKDFILASRIEEAHISDAQVEALIAQTLSKIQAEEHISFWQTSRPWLWMAAASVILFLTFSLFFNSSESVSPTAVSATAMVFKKNDSHEKMPVKLPDGSTVLLQPNSAVRYEDTFGQQATREVYLDGQAFFEVIKNAQKPFLVHIKNVVVKVLGTSFTIQDNNEQNTIKVVVKTGKVQVYNNEDTPNNHQPILLLPNQQVIVDENHQMQTSEVSEAQVEALTSHLKSTLEFNETPVSQVFKTLEEAYNINIYFDQKLLADCSLTTSLGEEPLFEKLQIICEAIGPNSKFEVVNEKIIIQSLGCNQ